MRNELKGLLVELSVGVIFWCYLLVLSVICYLLVLSIICWCYLLSVGVICWCYLKFLLLLSLPRITKKTDFTTQEYLPSA